MDDVRRPWRPDACLQRAGKRRAPQRSDHVPPRRLGNVSLPRFVCALPGAPPARHVFRALPAGGTGCWRLRVVGGELVVELAGGAVLSRAACVAVHTPRRTWEHGDDLRWVRGVLLTWVRFSDGRRSPFSRQSTSVDEEASARTKSHRAWCHRIGRRRQLPACEIAVQLYLDCVSAVAVQQLAKCLSSWRSGCDTEVLRHKISGRRMHQHRSVSLFASTCLWLQHFGAPQASFVGLLRIRGFYGY